MFHWRDGRERVSFPIDGSLVMIHDLCANHPVVIVYGDQGTGRTLRIPQMLFLEHPEVPVNLILPHRLHVRIAGQHINAELGSPDEQVSWQRTGDHIDRIGVTVSVGWAFLQAVRRRDRGLPPGFLVIDDVHEQRTVSTDLLLALVKKTSEAAIKASMTKTIIVSSSPLEALRLAAFFRAPMVSVEAGSRHVRTEPVRLLNKEHHAEGAVRVASNLVRQFTGQSPAEPDDVHSLAAVERERGDAVQQGCVLVFFPGKEDVRRAFEKLREALPEGASDRQVQLIRCTADTADREQDQAFSPVPPGTLRVILSTDILRYGVTPPGLVGVIDAGQTKIHVADANGSNVLTKYPVPRAMADRTRGLVGQYGPGVYWPVSYRDEYELRSDNIPHEMQRVDLTGAVLLLAKLGHDIRRIDLPSKPPTQLVKLALEQLVYLGAIAPMDVDDPAQDIELTHVGMRIVNMPLEPMQARILITAKNEGVLAEALLVLGVMEQGRIFDDVRMLPEMMTVDGEAYKILHEARRSSANLRSGRVWLHMEEEGGYCLYPGTLSEALGTQAELWIGRLFRDWFARGTRNDFVASVTALRAYMAQEDAYRLMTAAELASAPTLESWCRLRGIIHRSAAHAAHFVRRMWAELKLEQIQLSLEDVKSDRPYEAEKLMGALLSGLGRRNVYERIADGQYASSFSGATRDGFIGLDALSQCPKDAQRVLISSVRRVPVHRPGERHQESLVAAMAAPVKDTPLEEHASESHTPRQSTQPPPSPGKQEAVAIAYS